MQDRTINNALLALAKQGGPQGKVAEGLLLMRGVEWSGIAHNAPLKRGMAKRIVMDGLRIGPQSTWQLSHLVMDHRPEISLRAARNRAYQALLRLEDNGKVVREGGPDGCLWKLAQ
ncbi:hypothetical protein [Yoonia sediminilitoris]|uniref:Uncharacterized protein n=1 Tax=Yoonia sediminilitoris TaxID=1286148 RepID=A0A2T6KFR9_9RHOB|nr:hypothetical protein [Yoonia sediminilitoris]PUB14172.1 hypothetical protein C8N45_10645 [Yoonia sediminilitoris]RCW95103.1 hypothetical protein DFP92_10645 [Yoonia sediminilitoris]